MMTGFGGVSQLLSQPWIPRFGTRYQNINSPAKDASPEITSHAGTSSPFYEAGESTQRVSSTATANGRDWIKGVVVCVWTVGVVLALNVILTAVAAGIAYQKNGTYNFVYASLFEGKCSVAKNWATGIHLVINILSTIMLGASNYCMQCLASPSRADVDNAHRQRLWLSIGIPNIPDLLFYGKGRRRILGFILLTTSLPFHLIYNSAAYYSLGPSEYGVVLTTADSLNIPAPLHGVSDYSAACPSNSGFNVTLLHAAIEAGTLKKLTRQQCADTFAQDYIPGQRTVFLVTNSSIPEDQRFSYVDSGNNPTIYEVKGHSMFSWMCNGDYRCTKDAVVERLSNWTVSPRLWVAPHLDLTVPTPNGHRTSDSASYNASQLGLRDTDDTRHLGALLSQRPFEGELKLMLDNTSMWANDSWARDISIDGYGVTCGASSLDKQFQIDHCVSLPIDERCQLSFSPPICLIIICCSIIKLVCMLLAARDDREDVLLTVGDAISSFLTRPDPTTKGRGLLSKKMIQDENSGWHRNRNHEYDIPLLSVKEFIPQYLAKRQLWADAVGKMRWMSTLVTYAPHGLWLSDYTANVKDRCVILIGVGALLFVIGIRGFTEFYKATDMWSFGLGQVTAGTLVTSVIESKTGTSVFGMILLANTPQLVVSVAYFMYNALMTCMLLAAEYDHYATERKPLRVSWPRGIQRSTYYLSLPYRYSLPLLAASAILHWLVSQSLFFVEIIPFDAVGVRQDDSALVTCGYSPVATLFSMIVGILFVSAMLLLGRRRFRSRMPLAVHCSAAISAACHPITEGDHALQPVQWGEVPVDVVPVKRSSAGGGLEAESSEGLSDLYEQSEALGEDPQNDAAESNVFHCSFTSDKVSEPHPSRLYI
ncbi:hypothetical protein BDV59DRAFT_185642 [Aspergillus ambiguus]|uniref:uncharacterized protein n=1 Tax=Aspergillus ambiguus TaxID=176160 RepID=UPI003CCCCC37